jgi:hypothetical protein
MQAAGLEVSWTQREERRGFAETVAEGVTVVYVVKGIDAVTRAAVAKARERLRGRGTVKLEDDNNNGSGQ